VARIISFINFKGGVGKTALAVNLAASLAHEFGEQVLLVDLDPQSNASIQVLGPTSWEKEANKRPFNTVFGLLKNRNPIDSCMIKGAITDWKTRVMLEPRLDIIPSCYKLAEIEHDTIRAGQKHHYIRLWQHLSGVLRIYDYIIIDCPPNFFRTTECAMFVSTNIFIPCNPDALSVIGLSLLIQKIDELKRHIAPDHYQYRQEHSQPEISGIIINNKPVTETKANHLADSYLRRKLNEAKTQKLVSANASVLPVSIRRAAAFRTGTFDYRPLLFASVKNKDLISDYRQLANYIRLNY
jgi:chromosome partitioning protein